MTPKYWLKIVAGMLAVFLVGMLVVSGVRRGSSEVRQVIASAEPLSVPLLGMPFRTGKGELGSLQRVRIERNSPKEISGFHFEATLNDGVDADQFNYCEVTVSDPEHFDRNTSFDCLTAADSGFEALVQFGTITFQPSGARHRLMLPESVRDEIAAAFDHDAAAGSDSVAVDSGGGSLKVTIDGRTLVDINADSLGGAIKVVDPKTGRTVVDIRGN